MSVKPTTTVSIVPCRTNSCNSLRFSIPRACLHGSTSDGVSDVLPAVDPPLGCSFEDGLAEPNAAQDTRGGTPKPRENRAPEVPVIGAADASVDFLTLLDGVARAPLPSLRIVCSRIPRVRSTDVIMDPRRRFRVIRKDREIPREDLKFWV